MMMLIIVQTIYLNGGNFEEDIMTKKAEVVEYLKDQIKDLEQIVTSKDGLGKFEWCPASRCQATKSLRCCKYLLRRII